jgi:hypothetical protein
MCQLCRPTNPIHMQHRALVSSLSQHKLHTATTHVSPPPLQWPWTDHHDHDACCHKRSTITSMLTCYALCNIATCQHCADCCPRFAPGPCPRAHTVADEGGTSSSPPHKTPQLHHAPTCAWQQLAVAARLLCDKFSCKGKRHRVPVALLSTTT